MSVIVAVVVRSERWGLCRVDTVWRDWINLRMAWKLDAELKVDRMCLDIRWISLSWKNGFIFYFVD